MKKHLLQIAMLLSLSLTAIVETSSAQIYVTVRPAAPVFKRPLPPSPRHFWREGEWYLRGGRYEYINGYWALPSGRQNGWVPGHWKNSRRGWVWKPGHWRR